jgi:rhamnogalacturonyl hydrolase YesR
LRWDIEMNRALVSSINVLKNIFYTPYHFQVVSKDLFNIPSKVDENIDHLQYAMDWLKYAQDITEDGGVSAGYSFARGWWPSYPETTGYIIPTFLDYYRLTDEEEYLSRAVKMADWLLSIQLQEGAFQGGPISESPKPMIFDTGQVLQGLTRMYKETQQRKYLEAALKAANWLMEVQDDDGAWRRFTYKGIPHVYHTRVAWPLLELHELTADETCLKAVTRNIEWALGNQKAKGWFENNAFEARNDPFLHTIAYTIEGLLECAALTRNKTWFEAAIKPAEVLLIKFETEGPLSGIYNDKWKGTAEYRCLTGEAQMSVCWLRLFQLTGEGKYSDAALKLNDALKNLQNSKSKNRGIRGGIKGSHPIWGGYSPFVYPNWAANFFARALMLGDTLGEPEGMASAQS